MSLNLKQNVKCPKCSQMSEVTVWNSITVKDSEDLKHDLLTGKVNMFRCPSCSYSALMPTPMLYHDEDKRLMISFSPCDDVVLKSQLFDNVQKSSKESGELDKLEGYNLRFVTDYNELLEKILIFDNDMNSIIDLHSFGHDIETAWLLDRGLDALGDEAYKKEWDGIVADLVAEVYKDAYYNHSMSNECERGVVDKKRVWWVQAESVVGYYNEYQKHPEHKEYLQASEDIWNFIKTYVIDKREGSEWFMHVDDEGRPEEDKPIVEPWKCPYHNGRMCMEIMRRMAK